MGNKIGNKEYNKWRERVARAKAINRGNITKQWIDAGNKLTPQTHAEFKSLMKKADREFDENKVV